MTGSRREHLGQEYHQDVRQASSRWTTSASTCPNGSLLALAGPLGLGQDDAAADHRRPRGGRYAARCSNTKRTSRDRSPRDRNVGFVFQHYALFRHMTVFENVAFGLRVRRAPKAKSTSACANCCTWCGSTASSGAIRRSFPAANGSAWPWPGRWPSNRGVAAGRTVRGPRRQSAAGTAALAARAFTTKSRSPRSSSRTIRKRRSRWPIAWS